MCTLSILFGTFQTLLENVCACQILPENLYRAIALGKCQIVLENMYKRLVYLLNFA